MRSAGWRAGFTNVIEVVVSTAVLWANLSYLLVSATLLAARLRGWPPEEDRQGFTLGRWGLPVNVLAVGWGIFAVVNIAWPRTRGTGWYEPYAGLLMTAGLALVGGVYYGLVQRKKIGVLAEHRA